ncbi:Clp protease N-terminal domain-containing protein [Kineococcus sp. SYSU DK018]|uniref:Clp protease N-terminal domain-containing protein n=1 Tax=Kineococcus sp. SYSU DK018 TaxID=3383139 RepID=UPI003D7E5FB0
MLMYDDSFGAVMAASQQQATRLGADAYGSEHVLLGLLSAAGPLTEQVRRTEPGLDAQVVRSAVERSADDAVHLQRLGIDAERLLAPASGDAADAGAGEGRAPSRPRPTPRNRHTPEWQQALNSASVKLNQLQKSGALPRQRKITSAVLWLAVLEPGTRAHRLLAAVDVDAERVRAAVLGTLAGAGAVVPAWPEQARAGLLTRLVLHAFSRANTAV